jgi:hypothetical protein
MVSSKINLKLLTVGGGKFFYYQYFFSLSPETPEAKMSQIFTTGTKRRKEVTIS